MKITKKATIITSCLLAVAVACGIGFSDNLFSSKATADLKDISTLKNSELITESTYLPSDYTFFPKIQKTSDGTQITKATPFGNWDYTNADTVTDDTQEPLTGIANIVWIDKDDTSFNGKIGIYYDNVGTYNDKTIALRATYMGSAKNSTTNGFGLIMYNSKLGIRTSISPESVTIKYEFLDANTGDPIKVKGYQELQDLDVYQGLKLHNYDKVYYSAAAAENFKIVNYDNVSNCIQSMIEENLKEDPTNKAKIAYTFSGSELQYTWTSSLCYYREFNSSGNFTIAKIYKNKDKEQSIKTALNTFYYCDEEGNIKTDTSDHTGIRRSAVITLNASSDKMIPSEVKSPIKLVSKENGDEIQKDVYAKSDKIYYSIVHEVPGETTDHYYNKYVIEDQIDKVFDVSFKNVKVYDNATLENLTNKFNVALDSTNKLTVTAKDSFIKSSSFYSRAYQVVVGVTLKDGVNLDDYFDGEYFVINNTAKVVVNTIEKPSNEVPVKIGENPVLNIKKTASVTECEIDDTINYSVTITQSQKNETAKNIKIEDIFDFNNISVQSIEVKKNGEILESAVVTSTTTGYTINTNTNLSYGDKLTITYSIVPGEVLSGQMLNNTVTATASNAEDVSDTATVSVLVPAVPELKIEKTVDEKNHSIGDTVNYELIVKQTVERGIAKNVVITDTLNSNITTNTLNKEDIIVTDKNGNPITTDIDIQENSFTINTNSNLGYNEFIKVKYSYTILSVYEEYLETELENIAFAKSDTTVDTSDEETIVLYQPKLNIEKSSDKKVYHSGDTASYKIVVSQTVKNAIAKNVTINDTFELDEAVLDYKDIRVFDKYENEITENCTITVNENNIVIETKINLEYGNSVIVEYSTQFDKDLVDKSIKNIAIGSSNNTEDVIAENTVLVVDPVLKIEKDSDQPMYLIGTSGVYTIKVTQTKEHVVAKNIVIFDTLKNDDAEMLHDTIVVKDKDGNEISDVEIVEASNGYQIKTNSDLAYNEFITVTYTVNFENENLINEYVENVATAKGDNTESVMTKYKIKVSDDEEEVKKAIINKKTQTGDNTPTWLFFLIAIASALGIVFVLKKKK